MCIHIYIYIRLEREREGERGIYTYSNACALYMNHYRMHTMCTDTACTYAYLSDRRHHSAEHLGPTHTDSAPPSALPSGSSQNSYPRERVGLSTNDKR